MNDTAAYGDRVLNAVLGAMDTFAIYLGDRLGFYKALAGAESLTSSELASQAQCNERYVREWLEQQAVTGLLVVDGGDDGVSRRYRLPEAARPVLAQPDSLDFMASVVRIAVSTTEVLPDLLNAYRTGGGVPWSSYGANGREGQADVNRPIFATLLDDWFARAPALFEKLQSSEARIADVGCGAGWSSIALAKAFPRARVDGIDSDQPSIELASANVAGSGVEERVSFVTRDAGDSTLAGRYDLVTIFEALDDMSQPVVVLQKMRSLLAEGGTIAVIDENVAETFTAPGDEVERLMYGWSILCCLATGMSERPSAATGTVMRPDKLREYASEAGLSRVEVVDLGHPFFRMYLMQP